MNRLSKSWNENLCVSFTIPFILSHIKLHYNIVRLHWARCISSGPGGPEETHFICMAILQYLFKIMIICTYQAEEEEFLHIWQRAHGHMCVSTWVIGAQTQNQAKKCVSFGPLTLIAKVQACFRNLDCPITVLAFSPNTSPFVLQCQVMLSLLSALPATVHKVEVGGHGIMAGVIYLSQAMLVFCCVCVKKQLIYLLPTACHLTS